MAYSNRLAGKARNRAQKREAHGAAARRHIIAPERFE